MMPDGCEDEGRVVKIDDEIEHADKKGGMRKRKRWGVNTVLGGFVTALFGWLPTRL